MESSYFLLVPFFAILTVIAAEGPTAVSPTVGNVVSQPTYQQADYAPYQTYGYDDTYGGARPVSERTEDYPGNEVTLLQRSLRVAGNVGLFLGGGIALLLIGLLLTQGLCFASGLCDFKYNGFHEIGRATMRSLMTPDNVGSAAAFLQAAVAKYQHQNYKK